MAARIGFRSVQQTIRQPAFRQQIHTTFQRRSQSTVSEAAQTVAKDASQSALTKFWNSPVGPKTVHFWAPVMKWGLVIAGAADFARPASQLSLSQNAALMATGLIWTRWCLIIKPRNVLLASVNFLLFCVGGTQVTRILLWQRSEEGQSALAVVKDAAKQAGSDLEHVVKNPSALKESVAHPSK